MIEEIGIDAVTYRKVAEHAGMPLGSITQYSEFLIDMLTEVLMGLGEECEEKLAELNEVDGPVGLVADTVIESLTDLKRTRNEISFALLYTTRPKLRRSTVPGDVALMEWLSRNIPEAVGRAMFAYCYGALFQAVVQNTVTPYGKVEEVLRRLIGDSTERGDP